MASLLHHYPAEILTNLLVPREAERYRCTGVSPATASVAVSAAKSASPSTPRSASKPSMPVTRKRVVDQARARDKAI
eukprot:CAMPEP_0180825018 /NCGR_PEP_ID=MMETSP1038_2-20121128/72742_1 /TAXON_ID=632150 /ORGANISM="Azadinium spinosum, Strain 3D9" /LENGTH=76 /DNA_ID=CAMNT_0022867443 /DNA_START=46 /DNA_END=276 /DNA_ORIENTATION=+